MAHKHWTTWVKVALLPLTLLATSVADFTTECQRPCDCRWQSGNKAAICSNSSLKTIPANLSNDVQILDLSNNNLHQLHQEAFKKVGLSNLKKLFLKECSIEVIHKTAFVTLAIMIELDLSKNKIRHLHSDTFKGTEKLRLINLSNNLIDKLEDGLFRNLKFLQKVEASNNQIVCIGTKVFVNLPQLKILRFDGNNLNHMQPETLMSLRNLSGLDLHNNPWRCDCNLQMFRDWVISHNLYTQPTACAEPVSIKDKLWTELDSSNFACRPTILDPIQGATVKSYDENVTLACKVVGNPNPEVSWLFNGKMIEIKSFGELRYTVTENTMDLIRWVNITIINARYSDRGNYTCMAENDGGRDEKTLALVLSRYGPGTIAGIDTDSFAMLVGCLTAIVIIVGAVLVVCNFTTQNIGIIRLIKNDTRSSNGEVLIQGSVASEMEKGEKNEVKPVTKLPKKYERSRDYPQTASITSKATVMLELNKTLLEDKTVIASTDDSMHQDEIKKGNITQEMLFINRLTQDHKAYPPDLLSFPLRGPQVSPDTSQAHHSEDSPAKSPGFSVTSINNMYQMQSHQGSVPLISPKDYVNLPGRPRDHDLQVFSTVNGIIPYHDTFNMKLFNGGGNYYSLNKNEIDLSPEGKLMTHIQHSEEMELAPSPAPGTPHATIPRNSLSSSNIHNQLLALQGMANLKASESPLILLMEDESLFRNPMDLRISGFSVSGTLDRRTAPKPPHKPKNRNVCDIKEVFLMNNDNATEV